MDWTGVHPELALKAQRIYAAMAALGFPMRALEALRSTERQQELYTHGRSKPGSIVTRADGVTHVSLHQTQSDGFGHAVDSCFVGLKPFDGPWDVYGACGKALGLRWGGDFAGFPDRPHLELPLISAVQTVPQSSGSTSPT